MWPTTPGRQSTCTCPEYSLEQQQSGRECIPGSNFLLNGFDQRSGSISSSRCCRIKVCFMFVGNGLALTRTVVYVVGRVGSLVSAHGQENPFLSARTTDLTNGWLGWSFEVLFERHRNLDRWQRTILKRSGFWAIVLRATLFVELVFGRLREWRGSYQWNTLIRLWDCRIVARLGWGNIVVVSLCK